MSTPVTPVPDQQALQRVQVDFSAQVVDQHGEAAAPAGAVTVDITKADGTAVVTGAVTSGTGSNPRTYTLAAASNLELQLFTAVWKDGGVERLRTLLEVVDSFYFNSADVTAWDAGVTVSDLAKVRRVRRDTEAECERITGTAWVPRYARLRLDGSGSTELMLPEGLWYPRSVRSVRVHSDEDSYTALAAAELAAIHCAEGRLLTRLDGATWTKGTKNLVLEIEHGFDRPTPDLLDAAMRRFRFRMKNNKVIDLSTYARFQSPDGSSIELGDADLDVDQFDVLRVYMRHSKLLPGIA